MILCATDFEGIIFDKSIVEELYEGHKIYCKPIGITKSSKNNR